MKLSALTAVAGGLAAAAFAGPAAADSISFGDYFFYGGSLANGFASVTDNHVGYSIGGPGSGFGLLQQLPPGAPPPCAQSACPAGDWSGQFVPDAFVLYDNGAPGPVTIGFTSPIHRFSGFTAQPNDLGAYTATLTAYDGATQVAQSRISGDNTGLDPSTAAYFNVHARSITSVVISVTNDAGGIGIGSDNAGIPEPEIWSLMLAGSALAGAALRRRRRAAA